MILLLILYNFYFPLHQSILPKKKFNDTLYLYVTNKTGSNFI